MARAGQKVADTPVKRDLPVLKSHSLEGGYVMAKAKRPELNAMFAASGKTAVEIASAANINIRTLRRYLAGSIANPRPREVGALSEVLQRDYSTVLAAIVGASIQEGAVPESTLDSGRNSGTFAVSPMEDTVIVRPDTRPLCRDLDCAPFVPWLVERSELSFQEAYDLVAGEVAALENEPKSAQLSRKHTRSKVGRKEIAEAVTAFYGEDARFYHATVDGEDVALAIMVQQPSDVDVRIPFSISADHVSFLGASRFDSEPPLSDDGLRAAAHRLAEVELKQTVLVDRPLYRLESFKFVNDGWSAELSESDFLSFALTNDLLEGELVNALASGKPISPQTLPLRLQYLPSPTSILDFSSRCCVGGVAGLVAVAREDVGDYLLLVQQRSSKVLNLAGRFSVIPRAFHQPINEVGREIFFSKTLERELEEELLGREDLDLLEDDRRVDPLHPARSTEAMKALREPGVCRMECTGFGVNATNGNYELAALVVIDDPSWWTAFGHLIEANWESAGLQRYSSLDTAGLASLIRDPRWSSGGLFEFLQGLRRLAELEPRKVAAPDIKVMP